MSNLILKKEQLKTLKLTAIIFNKIAYSVKHSTFYNRLNALAIITGKQIAILLKWQPTTVSIINMYNVVYFMIYESLD